MDVWSQLMDTIASSPSLPRLVSPSSLHHSQDLYPTDLGWNTEVRKYYKLKMQTLDAPAIYRGSSRLFVRVTNRYPIAAQSPKPGSKGSDVHASSIKEVFEKMENDIKVCDINIMSIWALYHGYPSIATWQTVLQAGFKIGIYRATERRQGNIQHIYQNRYRFEYQRRTKWVSNVTKFWLTSEASGSSRKAE